MIESVKDQVLQQQQEQLNRALGSLHGSLNMCPAQKSKTTGHLDNKLSESIERYVVIMVVYGMGKLRGPDREMQ